MVWFVLGLFLKQGRLNGRDVNTDTRRGVILQFPGIWLWRCESDVPGRCRRWKLRESPKMQMRGQRKMRLSAAQPANATVAQHLNVWDGGFWCRVAES